MLAHGKPWQSISGAEPRRIYQDCRSCSPPQKERRRKARSIEAVGIDGSFDRHLITRLPAVGRENSLAWSEWSYAGLGVKVSWRVYVCV